MPATEQFSIDHCFYVPKSEAARINLYTKYEHIFYGRHQMAFNPKINFHDGDNNLYIPELIGTLISYTSADYLFGEELTITSELETDPFLDKFYLANPYFGTTLYEAALANSYFGDTVVEVQLVDGQTKVMFHDPRMFTVEMNEKNEVYRRILSFVIVKGDFAYIYKRIHEKGRILHELYKTQMSQDAKKNYRILGKDKDNDLVKVELSELYPDLLPEEKTGIDDNFLIYLVHNMRSLNSVYGMSDYLGKEPLMNSLNVLTSFAHLILEKNADPAIEVPEGTFLPEQNIYHEDLKAFQTTAETKGIPRYISPDLNGLQQLFVQRDHIIEMIALYSEISLGLLGKESSGGNAIPDNYRAMKLKFYRTLQKMNRKKRYWEPALSWVLEMSQRLLGQAPTKYNFVWSDGLPDDEQSQLEAMQLRKTIGIASNETLLEEWGREFGWSDERIKEEQERLLGEKPQTPTTEGASNLFTQENKVNAEQPTD